MERGVTDVILVEDRYYILATSSLADDRTRVLKHGETFAVFDRYGDVRPVGAGQQGLYHEGTRMLSTLVLGIGATRPLLLSSTVREDNAVLTVDLTNPDLRLEDGVLPRGSLHLLRSTLLYDGACHVLVELTNYALEEYGVELSFKFAADFVDLFEVRGTPRAVRGEMREPEVDDAEVRLAYDGLDGVRRRTSLHFEPEPEHVTAEVAFFRLVVPPKEKRTVQVRVGCRSDVIRRTFADALEEVSRGARALEAGEPHVYSSNEQFNEWMHRSRADLHMLLTRTENGWFPYAGVPWFSTVFGRDGILTALQCLWYAPDVARGVLRHLAAHQASEADAAQDAQPGKILHETRLGEMAATGEIPFGRYYGSIDSTPLFVMLAGAYHERTGDAAVLDELWPSIERAVAWIDQERAIDPRGFVAYRRMSSTGLVNQGWKDSSDSIGHADGTLAEGPIALCEVQGYAFAAYVAAARLAELRAEHQQAARWAAAAESLRARFEEAFWCDDLDIYALALDGSGRRCEVRSSNAGHCLFTGIAAPEHAARTARTLTSDDMFTGWGVRTLSARERRYDPMSYHNGSVWPHDNALIAEGCVRYGLHSPALRILSGIFDASIFIELHRLPELFCGFPRRAGQGPTAYPVACNPQAWAAASFFALLRSCMGLRIEAARSRVVFDRPRLPTFVRRLHLDRLQVGDGSVDLVLTRHDQDVGVQVLRRSGDVGVSVLK
jgi:glycogen debranching enzyme